MNHDPWTDPDPQPGDFDADVADMGPEHIESLPGIPSATVRRLVSVDLDLARDLEQAAEERHTTVGAVIADLWRERQRA